MAGLTIRIVIADGADGGKTCRATYISRKDADAYALRSQQQRTRLTKRACQGRDRGGGSEAGKKTMLVSEDDHRRPETTMEIWKIPPSFKKDGIVTAGNASGLWMASRDSVTREKIAKERGLKPVANRIVAVAGVDPSIMGSAGAVIAEGVKLAG